MHFKEYYFDLKFKLQSALFPQTYDGLSDLTRGWYSDEDAKKAAQEEVEKARKDTGLVHFTLTDEDLVTDLEKDHLRGLVSCPEISFRRAKIDSKSLETTHVFCKVDTREVDFFLAEVKENQLRIFQFSKFEFRFPSLSFVLSFGLEIE